jgi:hypothetical protein
LFKVGASRSETRPEARIIEVAGAILAVLAQHAQASEFIQLSVEVAHTAHPIHVGEGALDEALGLSDRLPQTFGGKDVNKLLGIAWQ